MESDKTQFQSPGDRRRAVELSQQPTKPPTEVPGYEPKRFLGAGAYGEVWVALDKNTGRMVAIKFFAQRTGIDWSLLSHEVEKLVVLSADRYIVQLLDVGWDADPPYYVMEYIENGSLEDRLKSGPISVAQAVDVFTEVAIGLSHAHAKGILHCDLKPANVLLDQDEKPRLADFGQARLADEQRPALGTLFYMAPEQADLDAVPDTRWDVYALGAVLYCMLTGSPPHRSGDVLSEIDSSVDLSGRLETYRTLLKEADPPEEHRKVKGVDRYLADIVDRCLDCDPKRRFPSVLSVINTLNDRERARTRRPLQILGVLGPLLLLLLTSFFGLRAYERATSESEASLIQSTHDANVFAAQSVARNVANELDKRFRAATEESQNEDLIQTMREFISNEDVIELLDRFQERPATTEEKFNFVRMPERKPLQDHLKRLWRNPRLPRVASWFLTDAHGTNIAITFGNDEERPTSNARDVRGDNFAHRTYFHGGSRDATEFGEQPLPPLRETSLSAPFASTATNTYKVAISTPIVSEEGKTLGVLAMTFELGSFVQFNTASSVGDSSSTDEEDGRREAVEHALLVDGRDNAFTGLILEHPLSDSLRLMDISKYRVQKIEGLRKAQDDGQTIIYRDPMGESGKGDSFQGDWIVGISPVTFVTLSREGKLTPFDTGLLAMVEHKLDSATFPVRELGRRLFQEGMVALAVLVAVSLALWYFVVRSLTDSPPLARTFLPSGASASVHSRETLEMPPRRSR